MIFQPSQVGGYQLLDQWRTASEDAIVKVGEYVKHISDDGSAQMMAVWFNSAPVISDPIGEETRDIDSLITITCATDHFLVYPKTYTKTSRDKITGSKFIVRGVTYHCSSVRIYATNTTVVELRRENSCEPPDQSFFEEVDQLLCCYGANV